MPLLTDPFSLVGRSAVVTGAASGIGHGIAAVLASAGAAIWVADIDEVGAARVADDFRENGWLAEAIRLDVTSGDDCLRVVDEVAARHGSLDIWVNNAGITADAPPSTVSDAEIERVSRVNFNGVVHGSQAAARVMTVQGRGSIVTITTGGIDKPMDNVSAYTASKAAAHQYSRSLALELAPRGVRVNAVASGWVETGITSRHFGTDESARESYLDDTRSRTPLGIIGDSFDQGYAVLYLVSDAARFITGSVIRPNGGTSMPW